MRERKNVRVYSTLQNVYRWRVLGLRVRPGNKTAIVTVEGPLVSATKKGAPGAKQNKGHVNGVFW
jgi:hypothetical protein